MGDVAVAQFTGELRHALGHALAVQFARGHEAELEARMRRKQPDELGSDVSTRAHQPDPLHAASSSVAGRCAQCATQRSISSKPCRPYQNTFHCSCLKQPSDSA